jgi:hypothetical protein
MGDAMAGGARRVGTRDILILKALARILRRCDVSRLSA